MTRRATEQATDGVLPGETRLPWYFGPFKITDQPKPAVAEFTAREMAQVQPMSGPVGEVFMLDDRCGDDDRPIDE